MKTMRAAALLLGTVTLLATACGSSTKGSSPSTTLAAPSTTTAPATTTTIPADVGTWSLIPNGPNPVGSPTAWTGTEVLVARAGCCDDAGSVDLAAYEPATNAWHQLPPTPLTPRSGAAGAWTGTEMVVAGGFASPDGVASHASPASDGAAWDAATNTWRQLPPSGLTPRNGGVRVWTGHELVVWGGLNSERTIAYGDGARLDPSTNRWRRLPAAPVPARGGAAAVWSGHEVLLWGGPVVSSGPALDSVGRGGRHMTPLWTGGGPCPSRLCELSPGLQRCGRGASSSSSAGLPTGCCQPPDPGLPPTTRQPTPGRRCLLRRPILHPIQMARRARLTNGLMASPSGPGRPWSSWAVTSPHCRGLSPMASSGLRLAEAIP